MPLPLEYPVFGGEFHCVSLWSGRETWGNMGLVRSRKIPHSGECSSENQALFPWAASLKQEANRLRLDRFDQFCISFAERFHPLPRELPTVVAPFIAEEPSTLFHIYDFF